MSKLIPIVVFFISLSSFIDECITVINLCKDITSKSVDLRLKTYLFCDYDSDLRPENKDKNTTNVEITIMPKMIDFDDVSGTLNVHCWTAMNWTDPYLTWNPEDFNGLTSLHVPSGEIWVPDITVHNSGDSSEEEPGIPDTTCSLDNNGGILCIPPIKYSAHCDTDYTYYPYDLQNCSVEFASWSYSSDEILLLLSHGGIGTWTLMMVCPSQVVMSDFTPSKEWEILKSSITHEVRDFKINNSLYSFVYVVEFILQRRDAGMHVVYVAPAIILMVMTLSVLWLDCQSTERMVVAYFSFICHLICIQDLFANIPYNGAISPNILQFYEISFLMMACTLVITVLLRKLSSSSAPAPRWLTSITILILRSRAGQLLLLSILDPKASAFLDMSVDDSANLLCEKKKSSTWNYVILIIGWLAFISAFVTYLTMVALFLPTKITSIT